MAWSDYPHLYARIFGAPLAVAVVPLKAMVEGLRARVEADARRDGPSERASVSMRATSVVTATEQAPVEARIAVIPVTGTLAHRAGFDANCTPIRGYDAISRDLREALADSSIDAILLDVDSPGGEVAGLPELANELMAARGVKPIHAVANTVAASAAYWLASAADRVTASPSAQVGSIGIVALHVDQSEKDKAEGLTYTFVHAGERKVEGHPHAPLSDDARKNVQARVDALYGTFVDHVAKARGLEPSAVIGTKAAVLSAQEAKASGLVDAVGTYDEALRALADDVVGRAIGGTDVDAKAMQAKIAELESEKAKASAKIAELEAAQKAAADVAAKARAATIDAAILALKKRAEPNALAEDDVVQVRALYEAGNEKLAARMGDLLVSRASSTPGASGGTFTSLAEGTPQSTVKATVAHQAAQLRAAGWSVETNAEGTEITKKTPPSAAKK